MSKQDLTEIARRMQMDLTAAKAKLAELQRGIAALPDDPTSEIACCPRCGIQVKGKTVAEHLADVHGIDELEVAGEYAKQTENIGKWPGEE